MNFGMNNPFEEGFTVAPGHVLVRIDDNDKVNNGVTTLKRAKNRMGEIIKKGKNDSFTKRHWWEFHKPKMYLKVGYKVLIPKSGGQNFRYDGIDYGIYYHMDIVSYKIPSVDVS